MSLRTLFAAVAIAGALLVPQPLGAQNVDDFVRFDRATTQQFERGAIEPVGGEIQLNPEQQPVAPVETDKGKGEKVMPFGWELFAQQGGIARALGINPEYVVSPGDRIRVQLWGAQTADYELTVDLQGNVFIPEVGPVSVGGAKQSELDNRIRSSISRVFTEQVNVYTNLLNIQPVGVFVTGHVKKPGRYAGDRTDSLLYFIDQAGGIQLDRGSFRRVRVMRQGRTIAEADLYDFLLLGELPTPQFKDNDTILVGPIGATIAATGEVRNANEFEIDGGITDGARVIEMARPLPDVSHVAVQGVRQGRPHNAYLMLEQFAQSEVYPGDKLLFQADMVGDTIFVSVTGQSSGPSSFAIPRGARLGPVLDMIAVDPDLADFQAIYLRRESIAERQKRALEQALDQLQRKVLTSSSASTSAAAIRVQEAQLVGKFVEKARAVVPEGRVVLANLPGTDTIRMESEDVIVIPQKSDLVLVSGEVKVPQTLLYQPGQKVEYYIRGSGGFSDRADEDDFLILHQNGAIETSRNTVIHPGDHIMVLPNAGNVSLAVFKDIVEIISRIVLSTGVFITVFN